MSKFGPKFQSLAITHLNYSINSFLAGKNPDFQKSTQSNERNLGQAYTNTTLTEVVLLLFASSTSSS